MGHRTSGGAYGRLRERLDRMPVGAPDHPALREILRLLFTQEEAELALAMPMRFATAEAIAGRAGRPEAEVADRLDRMSAKGLVVDMARQGGPVHYVLCPTVVGFFEFSMMRIREDVDQKKLAGLYETYMEEDPQELFLKEAVGPGQYGLFRPLPHEDALPVADHVEVLDYERASQVIRDSGRAAVGLCHCRHVKQHLGKACDAPMEICTSLGSGSDWVVRRGFGRAIDVAEALDILEQARERGLVQIADNVREGVGFICHCCGCCCAVLEGYRRVRMPEGSTYTSNFILRVETEACVGCGKCVDRCPVDALRLEEVTPPRAEDRSRKVAVLDGEACLGCGVCVAACSPGALAMEPRSRRVHTPANMLERVVLMALERGKLHHLLFDDPERLDIRAMGVLVGLFLRTPGVRRALLAEPIRSRYLSALSARARKSPELDLMS